MTSFFTDVPLHVVTETLLILKERPRAHQRILMEQMFMRDPTLFRVSQSKIPLFTKFCRQHANLEPEALWALLHRAADPKPAPSWLRGLPPKRQPTFLLRKGGPSSGFVKWVRSYA